VSWSFEVLRAAGCRPIVVPVEADVAERVGPLFDRGARVIVVAGGRRAALLAALDPIESERVVLHDANRPFATPELVRAVIRALGGADAAIAAVPVNETLKLVEKEHVAETVDRRHLWHPQTPQAYRTTVLREALEGAEDDVSETEAVRGLGASITLVPGSSKNIRVTTGDDLKLAEAIARAR
jgi:2-C-methyl-D-erythritol 4-phosphate cytidylyltransferase